MSQLRAMLIGSVYVVLFILSMPGIDSFGLTEAKRKQVLEYGVPAVFLDALVGLVEARRPVLKLLTPLQRPLRIEQSWGLYGSGPNRVRRMEVWLDDALAYRSGDRDHDWLEPTFRNRRLRPVVETAASKANTRNRVALLALIAERATASDPELTRIEVRFTVGRFPGTESRVAYSFAMQSPDWTPERL